MSQHPSPGTRHVLLGVFPHPDDESIAAGLTLLDAHDRGVATHVVTCTGGEAGENLAGIDLQVPMAQQRRSEMAQAAAALRLTSHRWLGHRDSGMVDTDANDHPDAFVNVPLDRAAAQLAGIIRELRPEVVISDNDRGSYGHPDHVRAHEVTVAAVAMAADPTGQLDGVPWQVDFHVAHAMSLSAMEDVSATLEQRGLESPFDPDRLRELATPDDAVTTTVVAPDLVSEKVAAMRAHRSQVGEESGFFNFPPDLFDRVMGVEHHAVVASAKPLDPSVRAALQDRLHPDWPDRAHEGSTK